MILKLLEYITQGYCITEKSAIIGIIYIKDADKKERA